MTNEEIKKKALSYLGLARKSGRIALGADSALSEIRKSGAAGNIAVIVALDASERTKKQINDKCAYYGVDAVNGLLTGDEIAHAVGKDMTVTSAALTDKNLASALLKIIKNG